MKLTLNIETNDPNELVKLFLAMSSAQITTESISGGVVKIENGSGETVGLTDEATNLKEAGEKLEAQGKPEVVELTPAQIKKQKIVEEIIALGGTPPEKGAVSKFQAVLDELKEAAEAAKETPEEQTEAEEVDLDDITADDAGTDEGDAEEVNVADVRTVAHALVKSTPKIADGKAKLGACLKEVGAPNLTDATKDQLKEIVPLIEESLGKKLSEVLAEQA